MLRILIADDHEIVRRGVRQIVEAHPGWEVCGEAADGQAALNLAIKEKPDVMVLDVSLPIMNGIAVTRRLRQDAPQTKVLLFTMHDDDETVSAGLSAGARGYLLKMENEQLLETAISALGANRPYFSSVVSELLLDAAAMTAASLGWRASPIASSRSRSSSPRAIPTSISLACCP